jgi:hypothetical protein
MSSVSESWLEPLEPLEPLERRMFQYLLLLNTKLDPVIPYRPVWKLHKIPESSDTSQS